VLGENATLPVRRSGSQTVEGVTGVARGQRGEALTKRRECREVGHGHVETSWSVSSVASERKPRETLARAVGCDTPSFVARLW
jgi:hypothetical protein